MRYVILLLVSFGTFGREGWLCSEDSTQVRGSTILACGIGSGSDEDSAKRKAFESAKREFHSVCESECKLHAYSVAPQRATCEEKNGSWKCYRLVVYRMKDERRTTRETASRPLTNQELMDQIFYKAMGGT